MRYDPDKLYREQEKAYRDKYTKQDHQGRVAEKERRMAGNRMAERQGLDSRKDLSKGQRARVAENNPVAFAGKNATQFYQKNDQGQRRLINMTDDNNPFAELKGDGSGFGRGASAGKDILSGAEARKYFEAGHSAEDIQKRFESKGTKIGGKAQRFLQNQIDKLNNKPTTPDSTTPTPTPTTSNTGDINIGGDSFGTNNTGVIDNSVTIGDGMGVGQAGGLSNLASGVSMNALNENQYAKSQDILNGVTGAAKFSALGETFTGASDRIKGLDLATELKREGYAADARNSYVNVFGDIFSPKFKPPTWQS